MARKNWKVGDWAVYAKSKMSVEPGPRARGVSPAGKGDAYSYVVDKYWIVADTEGEHVVLRTRRGKTHKVAVTDPALRAPKWWERICCAGRFRAEEVQMQQEADE